MDKTYTKPEISAWFDAMIDKYRNSIAVEHFEYVKSTMLSQDSFDMIDEWLKKKQS